jgi:NADPH2:quinone reductase
MGALMKSKIVIAERYGQSDVLEFVEKDLPPLPAGFARIQVKAAGINPVDARKMMGELKFGPLPQSFGTEFAGVIVELPARSGRWSVGDEVLGSGGAFTHATVIDVPIENLIKRPPSIDWIVAGSMAGTAQTAMTILEEFGEIASLLLHGGSGGVGSVLIQLAREKNIDVVATSSEANQDYLRSLGARPIVYGPGLAERIEKVRPAPFDAAMIMAGTEEATQASLARVKPDGAIASITGIEAPSPRIRAIFNKRNPANLQQVVSRVADGRVKWEVSKTFPFADARKAYSSILKGHTRGKSVLTF